MLAWQTALCVCIVSSWTLALTSYVKKKKKQLKGKKNFVPTDVENAECLMPLTTWKYKTHWRFNWTLYALLMPLEDLQIEKNWISSGQKEDYSTRLSLSPCTNWNLPPLPGEYINSTKNSATYKHSNLYFYWKKIPNHSPTSNGDFQCYSKNKSCSFPSRKIYNWRNTVLYQPRERERGN